MAKEINILHIGGGEWPKRQLMPDPEDQIVIEHNIDKDPHVRNRIDHDLNVLPWPVESDFYDEVHAYEVLEHMGHQGNPEELFATFREIWRVLKPGGLLLATTPDYRSFWALGEPDHKRVINHGTITFLLKDKYDEGLRRVYMHLVAPYWWKLRHCDYGSERFWFSLQKIK